MQRIQVHRKWREIGLKTRKGKEKMTTLKKVFKMTAENCALTDMC